MASTASQGGGAHFAAAGTLRFRRLHLDLGTGPEIYSDDIANIDIIGDIARISLFAWKRIDGELRRVLVCTLLLSVSSLPQIALKLTAPNCQATLPKARGLVALR
jgi:hypothetical protein